MANFYTDNEDIQFLFNTMDIAHTAKIMEEDFRFADEFDFAPVDAADALDNYSRFLECFGEICGDVIDPTAEDSDIVGNKLLADGSVERPEGINESLNRLGQAGMMGFTLPYQYGGLNCPNLVYTMTNEMVSRADASIMNLYGLQGIAETINAFASEELKQEYLPRMASGEWTGAMVLTEPDAGSDLQAVKTTAYQDDDGNWFIHGVKRFITNGCGEVLLVLARTEPEISDGRGLSLLLCEAGPRVKIRRLEHKLGINASPTCEIFFDDTPAKLIGDRQRGLITYVMSLMNGARIGIAAQSLGIGEAAYRIARDYAHSRKQFDTAIENFPAVRELIVDMSVDLQAARALTYYSAYNVDIENSALRKMEFGNPEPSEKKALKRASRTYKRINSLLTPMSKYYCSEMSMRVANGSVAVLGGSGYMKDYPVERHLRDSRITTIYEGTSQLQVLAAVRGVAAGSAATVVESILEGKDWSDEIKPLIGQIKEGTALMTEAAEFAKEQGGGEYLDLYGRKLVDMACTLVIGSIFCDHARTSEKKFAVAKRWLAWKMPELRTFKEMVCSGDKSVISDFEILAGPVPVVQ